MSAKKALSTGDKTILALSARGDCYNPSCSTKLMTEKDGNPIVQFEIAHIRDELPPKSKDANIGWRYFPAEDLNQKQRNHFSNLILLCTPCHKLIDSLSPRDYSVKTLTIWKHANEGLRGAALAETLGDIQQIKLNDLIIEAITSLDALSYETRQFQQSKMRVDSTLAEILRYRKIIDTLRINSNWVTVDPKGLTIGLSDMAHTVTYEIIADAALPSYVRQAAMDARTFAKKGEQSLSAGNWADYLQRDLKWEANRLRKCIADGTDPSEEPEPSFDERNAPYQEALKKISK